MPWCGYWATSGSAYWWVLPLIGLAFLGVMLFACSRRFGCMRGRRRSSSGPSELQREVEALKEEVRKLARHPN